MEALRSLQDALRGRRGVSMICGFIMLTIAGMEPILDDMSSHDRLALSGAVILAPSSSSSRRSLRESADVAQARSICSHSTPSI